MVIIKTLIFTLLLPGVFLVLVPYFLLSSFGDRFAVDIGLIRFIGFIPLLFGVFMYILCAWSFAYKGKGTPAPIDPPKKLVVQGLYKYARNPMYIGVLLILIGEAIFFASLLLGLYAVLVFVCFHLFVVIYEEPALKARFGDSYRRYCDSVPRWIPRREKTRK
ncbi:MAG: isoprenylcysteine carboxylmethyltransferase family protein [Candidatus Aminicenantes bacterium]|nr:MAG: isoprenylcysteine carboxylmethyltransferase family protein [Candidatus Aminicenantes bacterium]